MYFPWSCSKKKENFPQKFRELFIKLWVPLQFWGLKKMQKGLHITMGWVVFFFIWSVFCQVKLHGLTCAPWHVENYCPLYAGNGEGQWKELCFQGEIFSWSNNLNTYKHFRGRLEALSGLAWLCILTSRILSEWRLFLFAFLYYVFFIYHLSFQNNFFKTTIHFKWQFSFQFQAQHYYLLWHSPLKMFTLTDDIFFIHWPKGSKKLYSTLHYSPLVWE